MKRSKPGTHYSRKNIRNNHLHYSYLSFMQTIYHERQKQIIYISTVMCISKGGNVDRPLKPQFFLLSFLQTTIDFRECSSHVVTPQWASNCFFSD